MHARSAATFDISRERALQLFADEGFGQVSLRRLASHMRISTATLYTHVAGKEELLFDALEELRSSRDAGTETDRRSRSLRGAEGEPVSLVPN